MSLRILRRRWVLAVIFGCSLLYFITSIYKQSTLSIGEEEILRPKVPAEPFRWDAAIERGPSGKVQNDSRTPLKTCRNSVQGKVHVTDDRGYVCERRELLAGGCCNTRLRTTKRYVCNSCLKNGCCTVYEHCVSCCLQPSKQPMLRRILSQAGDSFQHLYASVTDHFELCLAKCRTSSESVQHENSYRDPGAKFCYGEDPPDLQPVAT